MSQPPHIVVLGSINMDLVALSPRAPQAGETVVGSRFFTSPGGKGANQAVACARLGARVSLIGRVGSDAFGQQLLGSLTASGVDVSGVTRDPDNPSGVAVINLDATGQNRIVLVPGANGACGRAELERAQEALRESQVLLLQLEVPLELSLAAAQTAQRLGKTVILDPAPAQALPQGFYPSVDYLTPNETEAEVLAGLSITDPSSAQRAARTLIQRGPGCVIVKLGAQGACYATPSGAGYLPAYAVEAVDTVAAGDAFNGALAVALAEGRELEEALRWALAAGALAVTRAGAQASMPHRHKLEAFLKGHRQER